MSLLHILKVFTIQKCDNWSRGRPTQGQSEYTTWVLYGRNWTLNEAVPKPGGKGNDPIACDTKHFITFRKHKLYHYLIYRYQHLENIHIQISLMTYTSHFLLSLIKMTYNNSAYNNQLFYLTYYLVIYINQPLCCLSRQWVNQCLCLADGRGCPRQFYGVNDSRVG